MQTVMRSMASGKMPNMNELQAQLAPAPRVKVQRRRR